MKYLSNTSDNVNLNVIILIKFVIYLKVGGKYKK